MWPWLAPPPTWPACLDPLLVRFCKSQMRKRDARDALDVRWEWEAGTGLRCVRPAGARAFANFTVPQNLSQLQNVFFVGCTDGWPPGRPPGVGVASLPRPLLDAGVVRGTRMAELRAKLASSGEVSVLAVGASVTALFGSACAYRPGGACAPTDLPSLPTPAGPAADPRGARYPSDWLVQLLQTLRRRFPGARISGTAHATGGLGAETVATCPSAFLRCAAQAECRPADLVVLDLASVGFLSGIGKLMLSVERLLRYWAPTAAVVLLNFPHWCWLKPLASSARPGQPGHDGQPSLSSACQRSMHDGTMARLLTNPGSVEADQKMMRRMASLAAWYNQSSASPLASLYGPITSGELSLFDVTRDGVHPTGHGVEAAWRRPSDGLVYSAYVADLLAHAIDPSALDEGALWPARPPIAPRAELPPLGRDKEATSLEGRAARLGSRHRRGASGLPPALAPDADAQHGVRCYGLVNRRERSKLSWGYAGRRPGRPVIALGGWFFSQHEYAFDTSNRSCSGWQGGGQAAPDACWSARTLRAPKPGLTSLRRGDAIEIAVDASVPHGAPAIEIAYLASYEQVGVLRVACLHNCTCAPVDVDALRPAESHAQLAAAAVALDAGASRDRLRDCRLGLTNASPEARRAPKVKVVGWSVVARTS